MREGFLQYLPIGALVGIVFLAEILLVVGAWSIGPGVPRVIAAPIPEDITNTEAIGLVLYTRYLYFFQAAGLVLLVAMIGAIVLTLASQGKASSGRISACRSRADPATSIEIRKVKPGQGV